jgi:hypothetical protein
MLKFLIPLSLLLILSINLKAQKITDANDPVNPFGSLQFNYGPTDTLTVLATYTGTYGKLSEKNESSLEDVKSISKINSKRFKYSISFKIDGCAQNFYMPCTDFSFYNILSSGKNPPKLLRLKCVVYHFYTIDGLTNFFYIEKAAVADKSV